MFFWSFILFLYCFVTCAQTIDYSYIMMDVNGRYSEIKEKNINCSEEEYKPGFNKGHVKFQQGNYIYMSNYGRTEVLKDGISTLGLATCSALGFSTRKILEEGISSIYLGHNASGSQNIFYSTKEMYSMIDPNEEIDFLFFVQSYYGVDESDLDSIVEEPPHTDYATSDFHASICYLKKINPKIKVLIIKSYKKHQSIGPMGDNLNVNKVSNQISLEFTRDGVKPISIQYDSHNRDFKI